MMTINLPPSDQQRLTEIARELGYERIEDFAAERLIAIANNQAAISDQHEFDPEIGRAWGEEVARRLAEVEAGAVEMIPTADARPGMPNG